MSTVRLRTSVFYSSKGIFHPNQGVPNLVPSDVGVLLVPVAKVSGIETLGLFEHAIKGTSSLFHCLAMFVIVALGFGTIGTEDSLAKWLAAV